MNKTKLLLLASLALSINAFAQIPTITVNNLPVIGDTATQITIDTTGLDFNQGASGASQTWIFSTLPKKDSSMNAYISPSGTPYFSAYPDANIVSVGLPVSASSIYTYEDNQTNAAYLLGFESNSLKAVYVPTNIPGWKDYNPPVTYLDTGISVPIEYLLSGSDSIVYQTYDTTVADAYGTLVLGGVTYSHALRLNVHYTIYDSIYSSKVLVLKDTTRTIEYIWYDADYRDALFAITYNDIKPSGTSHPTATLWRNPKPIVPTAVNQLSAPSSQPSVYPNPSNGIFQLRIKNYELGINSTVEVYNVLGGKVYSNHQITKLSNYQIDISNQPNGIYFYRVIAENGEQVGEGKIIIRK
ncbi:MAG: T9SS type A sorting domain-containing protein [Bacteroidia bacterium]